MFTDKRDRHFNGKLTDLSEKFSDKNSNARKTRGLTDLFTNRRIIWQTNKLTDKPKNRRGKQMKAKGKYIIGQTDEQRKSNRQSKNRQTSKQVNRGADEYRNRQPDEQTI